MFERTQYMTGYFPTKSLQGDPILLVIARRSYDIDLVEGVCNIADSQDELVLGDAYLDGDNPFQSSIRLESEIAPWKLHKDVVFVGKAYAPKGKAAKSWEVSMQVGAHQRSLIIFGPRSVRWVAPKKKGKKDLPQPPNIGMPKAVEEVDLTYENAYGGFATYYPEDRGAYRKAVRKSRKDAKEKEAIEKEKAEAAHEKAEGKAKAEAEAEAERQRARSTEDHFMGVGRKVENAPNVPLVVEVGSAHHKDKGGTIILDTAELAEAQSREESELAGETADKPSVDRGTAIIDADELAQLAAQDSEDYLKELKTSQATEEEGTQALDLSKMGDQVESTGSWIQDEKKARDEFYISLGRDPNEEVVWEDGELPRIPCPTNPVGKGFALGNSKESLDDISMPLIEDPLHLLQPEDIPRNPATLHLPMPIPAGFGFYSRCWMPRATKAGALPDELAEAQHNLDKQLVEGDFDPNNEDDQKVIDALMDREAQPMSPDYHNGAHPMWQVDHLQGDEAVMLTNLDASGKTYFKLPGHRPLVRLRRGAGWEEVSVELDTLVIEREAEKVHMVWRGSLSYGGLEELDEYPLVDIDVQDLNLNEWQERAHDEAIANMAKDGATKLIDLDALSDEDKAEFEDRTEQAGIGQHGVKEAKASEARELRAEDGALLDMQDREDVILADRKWEQIAKEKSLTDEERKRLEIERDERKAVQAKKEELRNVREQEKKKKAEEEAQKSKRTKKKEAKKTKKELEKKSGKKPKKKGVESQDEDDVPLTDDVEEKTSDKPAPTPKKATKAKKKRKSKE
jgi:hypothetical protein